MDRKSMWHAIHTSETGRLENLDQLTPFGKELLYTFVHLLLQGYNGQTLTELLKTYQWLENNPNVFDVSQRNVQRILSKYVSNNDCPENNFSSAILPTNGPCTDDKLTKAKECEATLKWKLGKKANGKENKNPNPSCYFSQFENPSIAMNESNQKTPKTPFTSNKKKPLQQSDLNTPKNVNKIQIPRRLAVPSFASPNTTPTLARKKLILTPSAVTEKPPSTLPSLIPSETSDLAAPIPAETSIPPSPGLVQKTDALARICEDDIGRLLTKH